MRVHQGCGGGGESCLIPLDLAAELHEHTRVTRGLRCDVDHERDKRRRLEDSVRQLEFEHEKSRANNAVALLENERRLHSLSKEQRRFARRSSNGMERSRHCATR